MAGGKNKTNKSSKKKQNKRRTNSEEKKAEIAESARSEPSVDEITTCLDPLRLDEPSTSTAGLADGATSSNSGGGGGNGHTDNVCDKHKGIHLKSNRLPKSTYLIRLTDDPSVTSIWRVDGHQLLQRYERVSEDDEGLYAKTNRFTAVLPGQHWKFQALNTVERMNDEAQVRVLYPNATDLLEARRKANVRVALMG